MKTCPFFNKCGGCKFDFASTDYRTQKMGQLLDLPITGAPVWIDAPARRRAEFCFGGGKFGFYAMRSKDIISITNCPNVVPEINAILPAVAALPWCGSGACLITRCDNGIDIAITSDVPYFSADLKSEISKLPIIRATWNGQTMVQNAVVLVSFDGHAVEYPSGAFLQPGDGGAAALRRLVKDAAAGSKRVADLFCGLGNFTFCLNADGFDIVGTGVKRDLFRNPLTLGMLANYDCVVMDPPRAGADAQCRVLARSNVERVIYVSCNPASFKRDAATLQRGGYKIKELIPVDQFVGSAHWELFSVFEK